MTTGAVTDRDAAGVEREKVLQLESAVARPRIPPFREVYEAHVDLVFRTLRRVGVADAALDDVVQDVFLSVHRALPSWEGRSTLRTWIYRIAFNAGLNHGRATRRRPDGLPTERADEMAHHCPDPEAAAATHEGLAELNAILMAIDEPKREVLALMELEGFTAPEVADLLSIPLNTVYSRLRLARAELERRLAGGAA